MNGISITKEVFEGLPSEAKLNAIFDCLEETGKRLTAIDTQLAKKRRVDTIAAGIGGFIGGIITVVGQGLFFGGKK